MFLHPLFLAGISGNLGVKDKKAGLEIGNVGANEIAMLFQQLATLRFCFDTPLPQSCVMQHVPDRHSSHFQATKKLNPD
ncbi:hypothetical protein QFZ34_000767 [Phyllobacterium ifriqiyense]|uniref:Uncharacterized protein n=1 Tax=Phyllobacterium ifriqiyense TaxID=314238 RepID=A0ABU0S6M6_9HYPH|nr:hypothetical protein [Phyllobacterium ifriqiyense]